MRLLFNQVLLEKITFCMCVCHIHINVLLSVFRYMMWQDKAKCTCVFIQIEARGQPQMSTTDVIPEVLSDVGFQTQFLTARNLLFASQ